jgi:endonuclease/exonuclease/phosphatase family metal-dependent hydrolase
VSQHSLMSWWRPVYDSIVGALPNRQIAFRPDITTWGLPFPLAIDHGTLVALKANPRSIAIVPLPLDPQPIAGLIRRRYGLQVVHVPIAGMNSDWVIVNLHLSPYDTDGALRNAQLRALLAVATEAYGKGAHVILGGDWNMVLHDPNLPSTTPAADLDWVVPFPTDMLPQSWRIVAPDGQAATVRTTEQPYVAGENYRTVIDGFVVSPNVTADSVTVLDNGFAYSDHMPVTARFTAR